MFLATPHTHAATLYWDGVSNGTWNSAVNWSTASNNALPNPASRPIAGDDAVFHLSTIVATSALTMNLAGNQAANSMTFRNTGNFTIGANSSAGGTGTRTLTLGAGGITKNSGSAQVSIGTTSGVVSVIVGAGQTWTNNSATALNIGTTFFSATSTAATLGLGGNTLTLEGDGNFQFGGPTTSNSVISGTASASLIKNGAGILTIGGANSYAGAITVNAGSLVINGNISTSSQTSVNTGGSLSGTGTVGTSTVLTGGTLAPGNSIGTLNFTNTLTLAGISNFEIDPLLGAGLNADLANVTNGIAYGGTLNILYAGASSDFASGMVFNLFDASSFSGSFDTVNLPTLTEGLTWQNDLASNGTLAVIPEPSASAFLGSLGILALLRRRRRA
jgi:autotransporter-associated beta strand protein